MADALSHSPTRAKDGKDLDVLANIIDEKLKLDYTEDINYEDEYLEFKKRRVL